MKSHPELIKPNLAELGDLLGEVPASQGEMGQAAGKLRDEFGTIENYQGLLPQICITPL